MEDHPSGARPVILPIIIYTSANMIRITPIKPEYRQIFTGRFEKEKIASSPSVNNLNRLIFASPCGRCGREYSTWLCRKPINALSPGRYRFFSVMERRARRAFLDIIEKFPACLI